MVASFLLFAALVSLIMFSYNSLIDNYGLTKTDLNDEGNNIVDELNNLNIITSINSTVTGVYKLKNPTSTQFDVLGALASAGIGVIKIVTSIITLPIEIIGIITGFYYVPPILSIVLGLIFIIYMAFILIAKYTRVD